MSDTKQSQQPKQSRRAQRRRMPSQQPVKTVPLATTRVAVSRPAEMKTMAGGQGATRIVHREFFYDWKSTDSSFDLVQWRINPANANLFPWLSTIARNYESYEFRRLGFEYVPSCSTTVNGMLVMSIEYDVLDPSPTSKIEMMANKSAVSGPVWSPDISTLRVTGDDSSTLGKRRYTLRNDLIADDSVVYPLRSDPKTYDLGYLNVATTHATDEVQIGSFFVTYEIVLHTPQPSFETPYDDSGKVTGGGNVSKTVPFGDAPDLKGVFAKLAHKYVGNAAYFAVKRGITHLAQLGLAGSGSFAGYSPQVSVVEFDNGAAIPNATVTAENNLGTANGYLEATYTINPAEGANPALKIQVDDYGSSLLTSVLRLAAYPYSYS